MEKTISQGKGKLPERFLREMELLLGREEYERYLKAFSQEKIQGLRVNTGKLSPGAFAALCGKSLTPVPWAANGFYYHQDPDVSMLLCRPVLPPGAKRHGPGKLPPGKPGG